MSPRVLAMRTAAATLLAAAVVASLTACSGTSPAPSTTPDLADWQDRMKLVLMDPQGQGSAAATGSGEVELGSVAEGRWALEAACVGAAVVHITVSAGATELGSTDVPCGASVRFPVDYRTTSPLRIRARVAGTTAKWWVGIDRPTWQQSGSFRFN